MHVLFSDAALHSPEEQVGGVGIVSRAVPRGNANTADATLVVKTLHFDGDPGDVDLLVVLEGSNDAETWVSIGERRVGVVTTASYEFPLGQSVATRWIRATCSFSEERALGFKVSFALTMSLTLQ